MDLKAIANKTIPASNGKQVLNKKGGITDDIIAEVLAAFNDSREQLKQFAPHLKAATLRQTLYNVWHFWKHNIKYQIDPKGQQLVKEPKALWALKVGDCKSLSVAVMGTLHCLGIKAAFRFTGYNGNKTFPTHVYVVVKDKGEIIPVDCVWKEFGKQKEPFTKNWDYNMPTDIYRVSGVEDTESVGNFFNLKALRAKAMANRKNFALPLRDGLTPGKPVTIFGGIKKARNQVKQCKCKMPVRGKIILPTGDITQEQMFLLLKKQGLEIEQRNHTINGGIGAIGDTTDMAYEIQITGLHNAAAKFMGWPRKRLVGMGKPKHCNNRDHAVSGFDNGNMVISDGNGEYIAFDVTQANEAAEAIEGFFGNLWKGIKNVGKAIGKGAKAVGKGIVKVVKAPFKLIGKGVKAVGRLAGKLLTAPARNAIMNDLPGYAPFFLYTFINDPKLLAKLPPMVKAKRDKAMVYRNLLTGKLQISAANFDQTVRNGIMLKFQQTPEQVVAQWIKDTNFQIGFLGAVLGAAAGLLGKGLKAIVGDTGENIATDAENFAPAVEDWGALTQDARIRLGLEVAETAPAPLTTQELYNQTQSGQYQQQQYQQYATPAYSPAAPAYDTQPPANEYGATGGGGEYPDTGSDLAKPKDLEELVLHRTKSESGGGNNNTAIMIAAAAAILLLATSKKKRA